MKNRAVAFFIFLSFYPHLHSVGRVRPKVSVKRERIKDWHVARPVILLGLQPNVPLQTFVLLPKEQELQSTVHLGKRPNHHLSLNQILKKVRQFAISTNKSRYKFGEIVSITIKNIGTDPLTFPNSILGLKIENTNTQEKYPLFLAQVITTLDSGGSKSLKWNQRFLWTTGQGGKLYCFHFNRILNCKHELFCYTISNCLSLATNKILLNHLQKKLLLSLSISLRSRTRAWANRCFPSTHQDIF